MPCLAGLLAQVPNLGAAQLYHEFVQPVTGHLGRACDAQLEHEALQCAMMQGNSLNPVALSPCCQQGSYLAASLAGERESDVTIMSA